MTEVAHLFGELLNLGAQMADEPKVAPAPAVVDTLTERLGWPRERVDQGIETFSLGLRESFFPEGAAAEAWPWRFNRDLSYVRRPLLIREVPGAPSQLIWGIRHLDRVGPYVLNLIQAGQLKARSPELRAYMGAMRHQEGEAFNDLVAEVYEGRPNIIVRSRVKKIGKLRIERARGETIGDVDVLVADTVARQILAIETKDFEIAKTPVELRNELQKLVHGDGSAVNHHTERIEWLRGHVPEIVDWLGVNDSAHRWRVDGLIVTSRSLLGPYIAQSPIEVMTLEDLRTRA